MVFVVTEPENVVWFDLFSLLYKSIKQLPGDVARALIGAPIPSIDLFGRVGGTEVAATDDSVVAIDDRADSVVQVDVDVVDLEDGVGGSACRLDFFLWRHVFVDVVEYGLQVEPGYR